MRPVVSHVGPDRATAASVAVFVDRDGVVNEQRTGKYVHSWSDFTFLPDAIDAFVALAEAGIATFVVTNQGGVGRGFLSAASLDDIHHRMVSAIREAGGRLDAIIHCPHAPAAGCNCRKPRPGMLIELASRFALRLDRATFIGDNVTDLEAGRDAGCTTILVATGEGVRSAARLGIASPQGSGAADVQCIAMPGLRAVAPGLAAAVAYLIERTSPL